MILPARIPNLLINGSEGIAVGMATRIPPHNLREVASGVSWALDHPDATAEELLEELVKLIPGPDFPTKGLIVGRDGIADAYRTGRGSIRMRAVVTVEEDVKGRTDPRRHRAALPGEPRQPGRVDGGARPRGQGRRHRRHQRRVVRPNRHAHRRHAQARRGGQGRAEQPVQAHPAADDVRRATCSRSSTACRARCASTSSSASTSSTRSRSSCGARSTGCARPRSARTSCAATSRPSTQLDAVIALIRRSPSAEEARSGLMELLEVDEIQATAILDLQLRRLAALERQRIIDEAAEIEARIADLNDILAKPGRQRQIIRDELNEIVDKYGDERRTVLVPYDGDVSMEDLIADEDVVVTITRTGYAKRTKTDLYRAQRRGGKGVQGAALKTDDIVAHFFVCSTHDWILFFTNKGRVYRAKTYELPEANRNARGQHVANLLAFQPDETIAQVITIRNYEVAPYLVLATKTGLVKKTKLTDFDSNRTGGVIAINLREDDELIAAALISADRRSAAGQQQGDVDPVLGRRRGAAADGPGHLGCDRHEVRRRRRAAGHGGRPGRHGNLGSD